MRFKALHISIIAVTLFLLSSCSDTTQNPVNPGIPTPEITHASSNNPSTSHYLLGYMEGMIDPVNETWELTSVRVSTVHLNILKFLEAGPCTNCFQLTDIEILPDHDIVVDFTITHPFPTQYVEFTVFDTRGIIMFDGNMDFPEFDVAVPQVSEGNPILANADGFTTLYHPATEGNGFWGYYKGKIAPDFATPTATLNGYKVYYNSENRRYFIAGSAKSATYIVRPPTGVAFTFGYAVDCSWDLPTEPIVVPTSFPDTANCWEAYKIETSLDHGLATADNATATMTVDVYDWQGAATIVDVQVEGPYFWTGLKTGTAVGGGPGDKRFEVGLVNEYNFVPPGNYPVLVRVTDTASQPPELIDNIAWQLVEIPVFINHLPECSADVSEPEPDPGETVTFTDTSTDPDGDEDIVESWWDWTNDDVWDEEGFEVEHTFSSTGIVYVDHMVKDSAGGEDSLDDPMEFDIGMYITLHEDFDHKQPGMQYQFQALDANYAAGSVINLEDTNGPWDFTALSFDTDENWRRIIDDTDPEVAGFVGDFHENTTHFVKLENMFDPLFNFIYQAEYHFFNGNLLYNYGFYEPTIVGSAPFTPPADTVAVPYPLSSSTNYSFIKDNPGFYLDYKVKAIEAGEVTVPYDGGTTYICLLVRYRFNVLASPPLQGGFLNFAFITDDGMVVANVTSINKPPDYNWNTSTNMIYSDGDALFQALYDIP